jgi:protein-S-isoprenylcysteine O-methyltransferase Ste14
VPLVPVGLRDRGGRGTPALGRAAACGGGPYRWVRNPINIAPLLIVIAGAWLFLSPPLLVCTRGRRRSPSTLFVIGYEEPTLRRRFGEKYVEYRRSVLRWFPRRPRRS